MSGVLFDDMQSDFAQNVKRVNQLIEENHNNREEIASMPNPSYSSRTGWGLRNKKIDIFEAQSCKTQNQHVNVGRSDEEWSSTL